MIPRKPYVPKPMAHSPRDHDVFNDVRGYMIRTYHNDGEYKLRAQVRTQDAGQCLAAMFVAKANCMRLLVYAIGWVYGEECLALVDEQWLRQRMQHVQLNIEKL